MTLWPRWESFNPRPREGGDLTYLCTGAREHVSIHAPARGATNIHPELDALMDVSIHAPARGATMKRVEEEQTP